MGSGERGGSRLRGEVERLSSKASPNRDAQ